MKIKINLTKKYFIILLSFILVLSGSILVYTFNTHQPEVMGHNIREIDWSEQINVPVSAAEFCLNNTCKAGWLNLTAVCGNCGLGWWGQAKYSSPHTTLIYPSCDTANGWQSITTFNKWSLVTPAYGPYSSLYTKNIYAPDSCCNLCYKYQ